MSADFGYGAQTDRLSLDLSSRISPQRHEGHEGHEAVIQRQILRELRAFVVIFIISRGMTAMGTHAGSATPS
jgi:hypothetical protein